MRKKPLGAIEEHFCKVNDPRKDRTKGHKLMDVIAIAICAVICGAEGWVDIEKFGNNKIIWLKTFLEMPNGIPSHDTFGRVFSLIDAQEFQAAFYTAPAVRCRCAWVWAVYEITQGQIISIDGKCLRGFKNWAGLKSIAMVICTRMMAGKETKYVRFYTRHGHGAVGAMTVGIIYHQFAQ